MPKKVFFSFDYKNDMDRVLAVRDVGVPHKGDGAADFIVQAAYEQICKRACRMRATELVDCSPDRRSCRNGCSD